MNKNFFKIILFCFLMQNRLFAHNPRSIEGMNVLNEACVRTFLGTDFSSKFFASPQHSIGRVLSNVLYVRRVLRPMNELPNNNFSVSQEPCLTIRTMSTARPDLEGRIKEPVLFYSKNGRGVFLTSTDSQDNAQINGLETQADFERDEIKNAVLRERASHKRRILASAIFLGFGIWATFRAASYTKNYSLCNYFSTMGSMYATLGSFGAGVYYSNELRFNNKFFRVPDLPRS